VIERKGSSFLPLIIFRDLDLWGTDLDFACDTLPSLKNHLCQVIWKPIDTKQLYSPITAKCPSFSTLTYDCDLDLPATVLNFACNKWPSLEEHLCQVILKSSMRDGVAVPKRQNVTFFYLWLWPSPLRYRPGSCIWHITFSWGTFVTNLVFLFKVK